MIIIMILFKTIKKTGKRTVVMTRVRNGKTTTYRP